jgi:hypothetical protein
VRTPAQEVAQTKSASKEKSRLVLGEFESPLWDISGRHPDAANSIGLRRIPSTSFRQSIYLKSEMGGTP